MFFLPINSPVRLQANPKQTQLVRLLYVRVKAPGSFGLCMCVCVECFLVLELIDHTSTHAHIGTHTLNTQEGRPGAVSHPSAAKTLLSIFTFCDPYMGHGGHWRQRIVESLDIFSPNEPDQIRLCKFSYRASFWMNFKHSLLPLLACFSLGLSNGAGKRKSTRPSKPQTFMLHRIGSTKKNVNLFPVGFGEQMGCGEKGKEIKKIEQTHTHIRSCRKSHQNDEFSSQ